MLYLQQFMSYLVLPAGALGLWQSFLCHDPETSSLWAAFSILSLTIFCAFSRQQQKSLYETEQSTGHIN